MFLTNQKNTGRAHDAVSGQFLILGLPDDEHWEHDNLRAVVRTVTMRQCGQFMMGLTDLFGRRITLSGTYGCNGLPDSWPREVWEQCVPVPEELSRAMMKGGGHNSSGSEGPAIFEWATANLKKLRKAARLPPQVSKKDAPGGIRPLRPFYLDEVRGKVKGDVLVRPGALVQLEPTRFTYAGVGMPDFARVVAEACRDGMGHVYERKMLLVLTLGSDWGYGYLIHVPAANIVEVHTPNEWLKFFFSGEMPGHETLMAMSKYGSLSHEYIGKYLDASGNVNMQAWNERNNSGKG